MHRQPFLRGEGHTVRELLRMVRQFIADRDILPLNPYGYWNTSILVNKELQTGINLYLQELGKEITAKKLVEFFARPDCTVSPKKFRFRRLQSIFGLSVTATWVFGCFVQKIQKEQWETKILSPKPHLAASAKIMTRCSSRYPALIFLAFVISAWETTGRESNLRSPGNREHPVACENKHMHTDP
ncbi:hypothetical protein B0H11DRAFT_1923861 [Mycena galericulata]|nr:hypothetical protein B0H11DRAFT_1923861 [Mycena galericulata]